MTDSKQANAIQRRPIEILQDTACEIAAALSALASKPDEGILSAGRIFQGWIKGRGVEQVWKELNKLIEKGKIKDGYEKTPQFNDCLLELLRFLDNDCPDEIRFQTLKKIFLVAATETATNRDSFLPYEYMKLAKTMSSGEIISMLTAYRLLAQKKALNSTDTHFDYNWIASIVVNAGFEHRELVEIYKKGLMAKGILASDDINPNRVYPNTSQGLTPLGLALCKYIESYEKDDNNGLD